MDWKCVNHPVKENKTQFFPCEVFEDPLKVQGMQTQSKPPTDKSVIVVPKDLLFDGLDPLSLAADDSPPDVFLPAHSFELQYDPWSSRRNGILTRYTTSERLSIITSFLAGGEIIKSTTTVSEKVKYRLEQLDNFDENPVRQMGNLTQGEYAVKIEQLHVQLGEAWNSDHRVRALKIVIQCAKLLSDTSVMQFYPSKFVLITDILDIFGKLVFDRLKNKSEYFCPGSTTSEKLPDNFTPEMVPETTKETCYNWFYKVASIRELLPRFYAEAAILRSYQFLGSSDLIVGALNRLALIARGIGDPLVSAYARCYLCRVGMSITMDKTYIRQIFDDTLVVYLASPPNYWIFLGSTKAEVARQRLTTATYISLYAPALEWILHGLVVGSTDYVMDGLVLKSQELKNCSFIFHAILMSFPKRFIALRALHFVNILCKCDTEGYSRSQLLRALGTCLSDTAPPQDQIVDVFEYIWRTVGTFTQIEEYLTCIETWIPFIATNLTLKEIKIVLNDLLSRCNASNTVYEQFYPELRTIVDRIVIHSVQLEPLLAADTFLAVIGLFKKESVKVEVCKGILKRLMDTQTPTTVIQDPVHVNALLHISKTLNDSVNTLTVEDERRQISDYVNYFICCVDFGTDFEQKLSFCVDARATFPNLEVVYATLVQLVNKLAMETWKMMEGRHTRKTAAFVKSCIAYNFVTIPSILSITTRLDLYLLTGKVALMNGCLGQADACFEGGLGLVLEMPKQMEFDGKIRSSESYLLGYLKNFLATLIVVPDSPDQGVLHLLRLLIDITKKYGFETSVLISLYFDILDTLCVMSQEVYPYHIPNVISNDELYGHDSKYINEINILCTQMCSQILINLKVLADNSNFRQQAKFALELFARICHNSMVTDDKAWQLAVNLFNLAAKQKGQVDPQIFIQYLKKLEESISECEDSNNRQRLNEILKKARSKIQ